MLRKIQKNKKATLALAVGLLVGNGATIDKAYAANTVLGEGATANGNYSTAVGQNATTKSNVSTAVGYFATTDGASSTAVGANATANGNSSTAVGQNATAKDNGATALGWNATADRGGMALGASATAGLGAMAIGSSATASDGSMALGNNAKATGDYSTAIGRNSIASEDSMALGFNAESTGKYSIAIGRSSTTNEDYTVSFGDSRITRRLTHVSDGIADSDAVNVSQLKQAVANAGGVSSADLDKKTDTDLGNITSEGRKVITDLADSVDNTAEVTTKDANLKVSSEKNGNVTIYDVALSRDLDLDSLSVGGKTYISSTGINANNQKITNIAAGKMAEGSTDAVNGDQLYKVSSDIQNSINDTVNNINANLENKVNASLDNITNEGQTVIENIAKGVDTTAEVTTSDKNLKVTSQKEDNTTTYDVAMSPNIDLESLSIAGKTYITNTGINANSQKVVNVADGEISSTSTDAVNGSQLHKVSEDLQSNINDIGNTINNTTNTFGTKLEGKVNINLDNITEEGKTIIKELADSVDDATEVTTSDKNLKVSSSKSGNVTTYDVTMAKNLDLESLSIGGKTYVTNTGINANAQKVVNVAAGEVSTTSTDAINGSQLHKVSEDLQSSIDDISNTITNNANNFDTKLENKVNTSLDNITNKGKTVIENIAKGIDTTAEVTTSDKNLKVTAEKNGNITTYDLAMSRDLDIDSLSIGGKTYISSTGINANGQKIVNVANGEVSETSTDAVNGSQLRKVSEDLQSSINDIGNAINNTTNAFDTKLEGKVNINLDNISEDGKTVIRELADSVDDTAEVTTSDKNLEVTATKKGNVTTYDVAMTKNLDLESLSINGKTYITNTGINANSQKITNVANGDVSQTSTDAVNGSQLHEVSENLQNRLDDINNSITNTTNNFDVKLDGKVNTSLDNITNDGRTVIENIVKGVDTTAEVTTSDKNLKVTSQKEGNTTTYDVAMNRNLDIDSLSIGGKTYISSTGINANSQKITNVAEGSVSEGSTDAVTGGQVYEIKESIIRETAGELNSKASTSLDNLTKDGESVIKELAKSVDSTSIIKAGDENLVVESEKDGNNTVYTVKLGDTIRANAFGVGNEIYISAEGLNANSHRIVNVAAGVKDTDAANVGQLRDAIKDSQNPLSVDYDTDKKDKLTLQGENGTTITNVKAGEVSKDSTDAVNGSQLYETNQRVEKNAKDIREIKDSVSQNASDISKNASAIESLRDADEQSVKYSSDDKSEIVLAGSEGTVIKNVKAATADDEAVNFKQMTDAINEVVVKGDKNAIHYSDDSHKKAVLDGEGGTVLDGVADGKVSKDSKEAVNGSQLYAEQEAREKADKELSERIGALDENGEYSYINAKNNVSQNLAVLDKAVEQTAKVVQDNGKEIRIAGESSTKVINVAGNNGEARVITGVQTNPEDATSAANVEYVNQQTKEAKDYANGIGAQAAAMATLHPLDWNKNDKVSVSAAVGSYKSDVAGAVGAYYRPDSKTMMSLQGSFGSSNNMLGLGISKQFGKASEFEQMSDDQIRDKIEELSESNKVLKDSNESLRDSNEALKDSNESLRDEVSELYQKNSLLESSLSEVKNAYNSLMAKVNGLMAKIGFSDTEAVPNSV